MISNKQILFETLEKQRGSFVKIAFMYFIVVIIGLGLVVSLQATLDGILIFAISIIFMFVVSFVFIIISKFLYEPIESFGKQIKDVVMTIYNESEVKEKEGT